MAPPLGTNPFDEDDVGDDMEIRVNTSTNPFDEESDYVSNPVVTFDETQDEDEEVPGDDLPVEASWQYLGDLPYRRVSVYSDVSWDEKDGILNDGLAAFPESYVNAKRQSNILDARDLRELLSTTTNTKVSGCPHGGPVAAVTLPVLGGAMHSTELRIMTNSGRLLSSIVIPPKDLSKQYSAANVMTIGFTERTILMVVLRDSLCLTYDLQGKPVLPPFHILPDGTDNDLLQACIFEGGAAVLSTKMKSAVVEMLDEHDDPSYANSAHLTARRILPTLDSVTDRAVGEMFGGGDQQPQHYALITPIPTDSYAHKNFFNFVSISVLPRFHTTSRHPELFISTSDNSVVVVNTVSLEMTDVDCRERIKSPIVKMSFAPNGRFLACFTQASILTVISTSFETKVLDFDTSEGSSAPPHGMGWCGEDSVVLHWRRLGVLMVGPYGDWLRFPYDNVENLYIVPEIDCCRIVTDNSVEFLQRVPPATAALLRIGSIEPSAMLLDAADAFESGAASSDEDARNITKTGMLMEAIETCTDAATREFDIGMQKRLLKAASYGLHFSFKDQETESVMGGSLGDANEDPTSMPSEAAIKFTDAARKLRTLNALRDPAVGFVLTSSQFDHITATGVIVRLVAMRRPALAASISKYMMLPKNVQLFARASKAAAFVASNKTLNDAETAQAAIKIIDEADVGSQGSALSRSTNNGGYASVALAASKAGRSGVANLLLMLETSVADKVPALISTGAYADAMAVATTARDAEFIFFTLMEFEKACLAKREDVASRQSTFLTTVTSKFTPEGYNTLKRYLDTLPEDKAAMNLVLRQQKSLESGSMVAKKATETEGNPQEVHRLLKDASRLFGLGKDKTAFNKAVTDDQAELLKDQEHLRSKYSTPEVAPVGSSLMATIAALIRHGSVNKRESHKLMSDAEKLARKFKVAEKRLWYLKVKAFSESNQWAQLRSLADSKAKPPIGFKPFARAAIKYEQGVAEVAKYIDRIQIPEDRYDLFCEARLWKQAIDEAVKMKDPRRLANVRSLCNSPDVHRTCDEMMARLT